MPIKMSKAIEILTLNIVEGHKSMPGDVKDALNLAISCMLTVKFSRGGGDYAFTALLPNEAPEEHEN